MKRNALLARLKDACERNLMPCTDQYGVPVSRNSSGQYDPFALFTQDKKKWHGIVGINTQPRYDRVLEENPEYAEYIGDYDWAAICRTHDRLAEDVWNSDLFLQRIEEVLK